MDLRNFITVFTRVRAVYKENLKPKLQNRA